MSRFGRLAYVFTLISIFVLMIVYFPLVSLIVASFQDASTHQFTLDGFTKAFHHSEILDSILFSFCVALITALASTLVGTVAAFGLQRQSTKFIAQFRNLYYLPMSLPEIVNGLGLLIWFVFLRWNLGTSSLILSHISFTLPYTIILVSMGLDNISKTIFEAAEDLGANKKQIFSNITIPLLKPSLLASFLLSFVISFDDFLISYFTAGVGNDTLPVKIYGLLRFGLTPEIKSISTIILCGSLISSMALLKWVNKIR